jgi:hypothetical protein
MNKIDLNRYSSFVEAVTSNESNNMAEFSERIHSLSNNSNVNIPLLMTGGFGLGSEGGEFQEIVKKILFQGKPLNEENIFHMKRELGDIMWYWSNACRALNLDPNDVIAENVRKLEARYPGGTFDAYYSENRQDGDL